MQRILVLNPKGGSGKTTIATNLASYYASQGDRPLLSDNDVQGSSARWLKKRTAEQPCIFGLAAFERNNRMTRAWQMRIPAAATHVVVDTPAALLAQDMPEMTRGADAIVIPVLPSDIDIHAFSKCIADLLLIAKVRRDENRLAVVANRVKRNTLVFQSLMRFLGTLRIPVVATLRDSQNYVRAAEQGIGLHEMKPSLVEQDLEDWKPLLAWLRAKECAGPPRRLDAAQKSAEECAQSQESAQGSAQSQGTARNGAQETPRETPQESPQGSAQSQETPREAVLETVLDSLRETVQETS